MLKYVSLVYVLLLSMLHSFGQSTIVVDAIPGNTPPNDAIHIAGDFQGWDPTSNAHTLLKDTVNNTFRYTLPANTGPIEFKFTRGSWATVESDAAGNFVPDRTHNPVNGDTVYLQIEGWEDLNGNGGTGGQSTAAANVTIVSDSFYMPQFNRYRRVWIYLPPDYHFTSDHYPVLYMHDGQNVFDANTSFSGEWEVDETLNQLHSEGDEGIIVVAIDNGGSERINEYTPWSHPTYGGGDGADYVDFLVDDLVPFINTNYRTLTDRENTGIMGSSLGGLISVYGAIKYQNTFSKVGSLSPAYWINPAIFNYVGNIGQQQPMRFYQIMGTPEGAGNVDRMFQMEDALITAGFDSSEVKSLEISDGQHSEWFWRREFEAAYKWLFRSEATGIESTNSLQGNVHLFPNPIKDNTLLIDLDLPQPNRVVIQITNSKGSLEQEIFTDDLLQGKQQLNIPLNHLKLSPGIYFCMVQVGTTSITKRFVVIR